MPNQAPPALNIQPQEPAVLGSRRSNNEGPLSGVRLGSATSQDRRVMGSSSKQAFSSKYQQF